MTSLEKMGFAGEHPDPAMALRLPLIPMNCSAHFLGTTSCLEEIVVSQIVWE